jgi:DNA adenine methylase
MQLSKWTDRDKSLCNWLVQYIPRGYIYVEPFADATSPLWYLPNPFPVEVINDLYVNIVRIYRTLQDTEKYNVITYKLAETPFSQNEFTQAVKTIRDPNSDDTNKIWAFFVIHNEYLLKIKEDVPEFEKFLNNLSADLPLRLKLLVYWYDRLSRVQIDCVDAIQCIKYWDTPDTVFYIEPPYGLDTEFHKNLVDTLLLVKGKVLLFSYEYPAYKDLLDIGWQKLHNDALHCNNVLYLNCRNVNPSENSEKQKVKGELFDI